jgi:hypothetical protein
MFNTDPNLRETLPYLQDLLTECFGHGTRTHTLYVGGNRGRSRPLTRNDSVLRVFGLAVAVGGVEYVP